MASCRICKHLNTMFKVYNEIMGWCLGKCMKKQSFVWADIIPCPFFELKDELKVKEH
ncbi:MAG: hypothetical protein J7K21_00915 [Desulfurococcales archaeon]|nr:hypothetical protein [Desulfurococcales archaeon]